MSGRRRLALALAGGLALALAGAAEARAARPGGGQSFSSPSSSSYRSSSSSSSSYRSSSSSYRSSSWSGSSSDSGGGVEPPGWLMGILYVFMAISGLQLIYFVTRMLIAAVRGALRERREDARTAEELIAEMSHRPGPSISWETRRRSPGRRGRAQRVRRAALLEVDPDFSTIAFADLVRRIYVQAYLAAGRPGESAGLEALTPYLAPTVQGDLCAALLGVRTIAALVADLKVERYHQTADAFEIVVAFTSNIHLEKAVIEPEAQTIYAAERWTFRRATGARTRPPAAVFALGCPNCGAPFVAGDQTRCAHCDQVVADGRFEWSAATRVVQEWQRIPPTLGRSVVEVGTDDPTIVDGAAAGHLAAILAVDQALSREGLERRVAAIFAALGRGWNERRSEVFRPFVSDALHDTLCYWLRAYAEQGLHNRLERASIARIELAKVERDAYFDAITYRVFAAGLDYTEDLQGRLVCGSKTRPRAYSEYWTLIRGRGVVGASPPEGCPSCAAPLAVTMAGTCDHCGVHLTLGEFDWVLSQIEQDEAYRG